MLPSITKSFKVVGISGRRSIAKMSQLVLQVLDGEILQPTQHYMVLRAKFSPDEEDFTVSVYTSDKLVIQGSEQTSHESIESAAEVLVLLARESAIHASNRDAPRIIRSRQLKEYVGNLGEGEIDSLVTVLLADLIIDLIVTERLSDFVKERNLLESEGIPPKLSALSEKISSQKGEQPVYVFGYKGILDLRNLRNRVAHGVQPMTREEVKWAGKIAEDVFELL